MNVFRRVIVVVLVTNSSLWGLGESEPVARTQLNHLFGLFHGESLFNSPAVLSRFDGRLVSEILSEMLESTKHADDASHVDVFIQSGLVKISTSSRDGRIFTRCILVLKCDSQFRVKHAFAVEEPEIIPLTDEELNYKKLEIPKRKTGTAIP